MPEKEERPPELLGKKITSPRGPRKRTGSFQEIWSKRERTSEAKKFETCHRRKMREGGGAKESSRSKGKAKRQNGRT